MEQRAICRTCPFMIHAVFERETSLDVWGWATLGARFQRAPCWWRFGSEKVFFLVSRLQFKLYLFQFWLLSVKLLLNDELSILQIHSVNRNPHIKCSQGHFVSWARYVCQWTHIWFSLSFSALQSNLSVLDRCGERFLCFLDDKNHFISFIAGKLLSEAELGWWRLHVVQF